MTMTETAVVGDVPSKRLFITGAGGYVGRNLVRHFVALGIEVVGLARSTGSAETVRSLGAEAYVGDILDPSIRDGMSGCDALIHTAADTNHGMGGSKQWRVNVDGTRNVLEVASAAGIATAIHLSSESVLADGKPLVNVDERRPYPRRPAGSYSRSKAEAERIALGFNSVRMRVVVVRPRMVWGRDDTTAIPILTEMARAGKLAWIDGGRYLTSTLHIANLCSGLELALRRGHAGQIYFLADDAPSEFRDFVTEMLGTQGLSGPDKTIPRVLVRIIAQLGGLAGRLTGGRIVPPLTLQAYAASAFEITLNIEKARKELGYAPVISREEGMNELRRLAV
ncbi:NAD-dependent epimerase/dehydratase family protein [Methylobacterium sp. D54C]